MSHILRFGSGGPYEAAMGYSRLVVSGDLAWTAGCTATVDGVVVGVGDAHAQTLTAFGIGLAALERARFTAADVVQTRMYVIDLAANSDAAGRAHGELFAEVLPAATMIGVAALLHPSMLVEVELVAHRSQPGQAG